MTTNFSDPRVPSHFEGFCGGRFWDLDLTWYTTDPDFTPCFQRTVLVWIPCVWLILAAPFEISTLRKASNKITPWTLLNVTRLVLCFVLVLLPFVDLVYGIFRSPLGDFASADYWALALRLLSTAWAIGCVMEERKRGIPPTAPTSVFFFLLTLCSAIAYRSYLMGNGILEASMYGPLPTITYLLYFPVVAIVLMLFCVSDTKAVLQDDEAEKGAVKAKSKGSDADGGECPETYAPFFSRIVFSWSSSLIYRGYKTPLTLVDVWKARDKLRADAQYPRFARIWEKQRRKTLLKAQQTSANMKLVSDDQARKDTTKFPLLSGKTSKKSYGSTASKTSIISKPHVSVMAVVFSFAIGAIVRSSLFSIISDLIGFVSPLLLQLLIEFTYSDDPIWKGLLYASLIPVAVAIYSICLHGFFKMALVTGMNVKTSLISALYRKALKLSNAARRQSTVGEIVNLMAVDAQRVMETAFVVDMIWSFPLILGITTALLWVQIGPSSLAGLGLMALLVPLNTVIARKSRKYQMEQMKLKDERLKLMTEILNGIKVLKLYAWEDSFGKQIEHIRAKEISILKKDAYLNAINNFVWICAPYMVSLVTFATFILSDEKNILDATTAFVSIALFNILKFPMALLPYLVANFVQASVSIKRLHKFLNAEELDPTSADKHADDPSCEFPIRINHGTFSWGIDEPAVLHDITVKIPRGKLTAVVGTVGCGKSSLLSAFLGEMDRLSGTADINGTTAYVAQEAWIRNLSLRENIVCGQKYDRKKYREVIQAAALQPDIDILIAGDETEIGEKGVNLSGGQKQRVAVARAVYSDRDVYLFDDPLSAVDAHVGKHIFQQVIGPKGILADKTRVLVTHGISHLPSADRIVVLIDGRISEQGTYKELMDKKGAFADYILQYLSTVEQEIGNEAEDPESEEDLKRIQRELEEKLGKEQVQRRISESRSQLSTSMSGEVVSSSSRAYYSSKDFTKPLGHEAAAAEARSRRQATKSGKRVTFRENQRSSTSSAVASRHDESEVDSGSGAKKPTKGLHGTLIEEEASETGGVKGEVFVRYFRAMGWLLFIATIFAYIASQAAAVFANVWLSDWSNSNEGVNSTTLGPEFRERNLYYLWVYGVVGAGQGIFIITGAILMALGSLRASKLMHDRMLENILQSPMSFFDTTPVGRINNRFGKDLDTMDVAIPRSVISMLNNLFLVFATLVVNTVTTPWFIAAILPVAIFYVVAQRVYAASARQLRRLHSVTQSPMYSNFGESIVGGPTIRAFQLQKAFITESDKKLDTNQRCFYASMISNRWVAIRLELVGAFIVFFASLFAVLGRDTLSGGLVGLTVTYALGITGSLNWLVRMLVELETNVVAVERVQEYTVVATEAPRVIPHKRPDPSWPTYGEVVFRNYSTKYREGLPPVLNGINATIGAGQKVGIVGRTGAGKSSLTLALFRILEPTEGSIIIDGLDVTEIGLADLRSRITIIPQEPILFSGSLKMNLDPFLEHNDDVLWKALEHAHLKQYVKGLPAGLEHEISEGGSNLSVGQRQLVCLARALLRRTKILVLDEATAAIDLETDELIQTAIRTQFKDCTVITIAHRINTIMDSDKVMVLSGGCIKEFEAPEKLLEDPNSLFTKLARDAGLVSANGNGNGTSKTA